MRHIRNFFYNFSDIIFSLLLVTAIGFVLYTNFNYLMSVETVNNSIIEETKKETVSEVKNINVLIPKGTDIKQLANLLFEYKIIKNQEDFLKILNEKTIVKEGTFSLNPNMTLEEIKSKVTN